MERDLKFRRGDLLAILLVAVLAIGAGILPWLSAGQETGSVVQIWRGGQLIRELSLKENQTVTVEGTYTNVVTVRDGEVSVTFSDCPGEDCVHSGAIRDPGRSLVCLPNRVEVRVVGEAEVDFVVG